MNMLETINNFVDTMISEQTQFENLQDEISKRKEEVGSILQNLETNEKNIVSFLNSSTLEDENIKNIFVNTSDLLLKVIQDVNSKINEATKGIKFINDFEKHFTVSVFGKVKAGKSYIGNFIMGHPLTKANIPSSYDKLGNVIVNVYDRGKLYEQHKLSTETENKECNGKEFYVNKSEATSTIQWVNIGAMCWFDTPGIGSITIENELLAKEYVKNSDLVIFACNSDAPGTKQDFSEIKELHAMQKPILLLLTQSDTYDYDVDDDGNEITILVPKTDKDRADQENYMRETLREQGMEDVLKYADILTVSAYLATEAIKSGNELMFEQSNIGLLLNKLTDITKNEAATFKRNTPKSRVNEMINSVIADLENTQTKISDYCKGIEQGKQELLEKKEWILERIKAESQIKISEIISKAKASIDKNTSVEVSEAELSSSINLAIATIVQNVCLDETIASTNSLPPITIELSNIGDMKMKRDTIAHKVKEVYSERRDPKGIVEHIGSKIFHKEYYTSKSRTRTEYSSFDIGINDNEILQNIMLQLNSVFNDSVNIYISSLVQGYYKPVEELEKQTTRELNNTINQLLKLRME